MAHCRAFASGRQCLAVRFQCEGVDGVAAYLQIGRHFIESRDAWMAQGDQRFFGLFAAHGQLGRQRAGKYLLGRFELLQRNLCQDLLGSIKVMLFISEVGSRQSQQRSLFRVLALRCLLEQLLKAGIRRAWKFAKARGGRAGTSRQQGSEAEGSEQPQASDHVVFLILDQIRGRSVPKRWPGCDVTDHKA
ncbi:hypothetical protein PLUA15_220035 [Pseudomonas lundensis]|uniref:Uncharacterized protein n=1 Tax=Pseudomonas lundensis TaxID=86185 RepID=A0AAX2H6M6_9PSED|nr:hypothetical protein PLUA15_220035 [Pseudomonas lundensis]